MSNKKSKKQVNLEFLTSVYEGIITDFVLENVDLESIKNEKWYIIENENIKNIAHELKVPFITFVAMVAVTSPLMKWSLNLEFVTNIIKNIQNGNKDLRESGMIKNANMARIIYHDTVNMVDCTQDYILHSEKVNGKIVKRFNGFADKTTAFFINLYNPENSEVLTLDVWMIRVCLMQYQQATTSFKSTKLQRDAMRQAYFNVFYSLKLENFDIVPHQFQAAIWVKIKEIETTTTWLLDYKETFRK